ncbi:MAG: hypothetical protein ABIA76_04665 [Candidatus Diapherotrites archaeon]
MAVNWVYARNLKRILKIHGFLKHVIPAIKTNITIIQEKPLADTSLRKPFKQVKT